MEETGNIKKCLINPKIFWRWEFVLFYILVLVFIVNGFLSPYFLNIRNLMDMTFNFMEIGIILLPMLFIIITGNIDLSVASVLATSTVIMGVLYQLNINIWICALIALLVGATAGFLNGLIITTLNIPAIVVTLGAFILYRGIAYLILGDGYISGFTNSFLRIGSGYIGGTLIPIQLLIFVILSIIAGVILHRTVFGRYVYAIGNNENTSFFSGVKVKKIKITLFTVSGMIAAFSGILLASRINSIRPNIATGFELEVITTAVLGGISIMGGNGKVIGAVIALFVLGSVRFGMTLINISSNVMKVVLGALLIGSILIPNLIRKNETA